MRFILALCTVGILSVPVPALAQESREVPDIILASRLDLSWSELLIARLRRYVMNLNLGDPLGARVEKEIEIGHITANDVLAPSSRRMVSEVGSMVGLHLTQANSKIVVRNIEYKLDSVTTDLRPLERRPEGQVFDGLFAARGAKISADAIELIMEIPTTGRRRLPLVKVTIIKPFIKSAPELPIIAQAQVQVVEEARELSFKVLNSSFESLATIMGRRPQDFELGFEDIEIPQVSISIGNRRMNIDPEKVREAITARERMIKELLIEQLRGQLRAGIAQKALDVVQTVKIPNEYWITVDRMQMMLKVARIAGSRGDQNVIVRVDSDFCTQIGFDQHREKCRENRVTTPAASVTTPAKLRASLDEIRATLRDDVNMVASVSEDFINKLVSTTVDAGYFDQKLLEAGAELGPMKAFVRLNERGDTGTLYVDIKYRITGVQAVLVGGNNIRFPLVLKCTMRIEKNPVTGYPMMIFRAKEAVMDSRTLRRGFPEIGLPSTVEALKRFEGRVVKTIREKVRPTIGTDIINLELPVFQGVGLESLDFVSDGQGRANAHAKLEDALGTLKFNP